MKNKKDRAQPGGSTPTLVEGKIHFDKAISGLLEMFQKEVDLCMAEYVNMAMQDESTYILAIESTISDCRDDGSFSEGLTRIKDALRELADQIKAALPESVGPK
jgi:hypothetical protein